MSGAKTLAQIRVGPAGWSYPDWAGYAYPSPKPKGFHEATYLAEFFDTIEINSSFYNPIRAEHAAGWIGRVAANANFMFTAKMWQRFTHEPNPSALNPRVEDEKLVRAGFDVLRDAGKLGAVLLQFPFSYHRTEETFAYLDGVLKRFADYPLVVEVRHATWNSPEVFELLRKRGVGFCNIDQPLIGKSLEPSARATGPMGYVRLHGRCHDTWFSDDETIAFLSGTITCTGRRVAAVGGARGQRGEAARDVYVIRTIIIRARVVNALQLISMLKESR
jgi:uncharacterized protein YecE (DUF72 family)